MAAVTSQNMGNSNQILGEKKHHEGGQVLECVAQTGCGIFIFGGVQDWNRRVSEQSDLIRHAVSRELD